MAADRSCGDPHFGLGGVSLMRATFEAGLRLKAERDEAIAERDTAHDQIQRALRITKMQGLTNWEMVQAIGLILTERSSRTVGDLRRDLGELIERVERKHDGPDPEDHAVRMVVDDLSALLDGHT